MNVLSAQKRNVKKGRRDRQAGRASVFGGKAPCGLLLHGELSKYGAEGLKEDRFYHWHGCLVHDGETRPPANAAAIRHAGPPAARSRQQRTTAALHLVGRGGRGSAQSPASRLIASVHSHELFAFLLDKRRPYQSKCRAAAARPSYKSEPPPRASAPPPSPRAAEEHAYSQEKRGGEIEGRRGWVRSPNRIKDHRGAGPRERSMEETRGTRDIRKGRKGRGAGFQNGGCCRTHECICGWVGGLKSFLRQFSISAAATLLLLLLLLLLLRWRAGGGPGERAGDRSRLFAWEPPPASRRRAATPEPRTRHPGAARRGAARSPSPSPPRRLITAARGARRAPSRSRSRRA